MQRPAYGDSARPAVLWFAPGLPAPSRPADPTSSEQSPPPAASRLGPGKVAGAAGKPVPSSDKRADPARVLTYVARAAELELKESVRGHTAPARAPAPRFGGKLPLIEQNNKNNKAGVGGGGRGK